jgi:hypothetical protein
MVGDFWIFTEQSRIGTATRSSSSALTLHLMDGQQHRHQKPRQSTGHRSRRPHRTITKLDTSLYLALGSDG